MAEERRVEALERTFEQMLMVNRVGKYVLIFMLTLQGLYVISQITKIPIDVLLYLFALKVYEVIEWFKINIWLQPYINACLWFIMLIDVIISYKMPIFERLSPFIVIPISSCGFSLAFISMLWEITPVNLFLLIVYACTLFYVMSGKSSIVELRRSVMEQLSFYKHGKLFNYPESTLQFPNFANVRFKQYYTQYYVGNTKSYESHDVDWVRG